MAFRTADFVLACLARDGAALAQALIRASSGSFLSGVFQLVRVIGHALLTALQVSGDTWNEIRTF